jgi:hypothetical protein
LCGIYSILKRTKRTQYQPTGGPCNNASLNGLQDPSLDMSVISAYREQYPWISFEVFEDAGQMLIFQKPDLIIPCLAESAHAAATL